MQIDPKKDLRKSLENWAAVTISNTENRMRTELTRIFIKVSEPTDQYSTWAMVGVGGALVAIMSNVQEIQNLIGYQSLKIVLLSLGASIIFGMLQRSVAGHVQISLWSELEGERIGYQNAERHGEIEARIQEMANEHQIEIDASIDIHRILNKNLQLFPQPHRWFLARIQKKALQDPTYAHRKLLRTVLRQTWYMAFQLVAVIAAMVAIALAI